MTPSGYPEVGFEQYQGFGTHDGFRVWLLGLQKEAQSRTYVANNQNHSEFSYYVYDGHGSTRALTDPSGNLTDTYDYDAFGNLIHTGTFCPASGIAASNAAPCTAGSSPAPTPNEFLFAGEQYDAETGHYYNRARYLNTSTGRFMTVDTYQGVPDDPSTLHKYIYSSSDPVDLADPSGKASSGSDPLFGSLVQKKIFADYAAWAAKNRHTGFTDKSIKTILGLPSAPRGDEIYDRPDIADATDQMIYEIKPKLAASEAYADIADYIELIYEYSGNFWSPGTNFTDAQEIPLFGGSYIAVVEPTRDGAILYTVNSANPVGVPLLPIPLSQDTVNEETIAKEETVANEVEEGELVETNADAVAVGAF